MFVLFIHVYKFELRFSKLRHVDGLLHFCTLLTDNMSFVQPHPPSEVHKFLIELLNWDELFILLS